MRDYLEYESDGGNDFGLDIQFIRNATKLMICCSCINA